jgi:NAD(P)-dependent dehydrogenase (short-subunit alcohol dehydrogenase family)
MEERPTEPAFSQQIGLVTGSTGGIGGAIASALAAGGAKVFVVGRDPAKLDALVARLRGDGAAVEPVAADLTRDADVACLADRVAGAHGRLDILVHCAGAIAHGKLAEAPIEALDLQYAANVRGPYLLTKKLLPLLKVPRGQIVFINSSAGLAARAGAGQFSATQHAFKAIADALREEVNADQVRVLSLHPGRTATPRTEALHAKEGRPYRPEVLLQPEDVASVVLNALALPWTAEVTSISLRPMQKSY